MVEKECLFCGDKAEYSFIMGTLRFNRLGHRCDDCQSALIWIGEVPVGKEQWIPVAIEYESVNSFKEDE